GLAGTGEFRLKAVWDSGYLPEVEDRPVEFKISSNEVVFNVVKPSRTDAAAVRLIEDVLGNNPPRLPRATAPPEPIREAKQALLEYEFRIDRWCLYHPEVCLEVLEKSGSPRFAAAAAFSLGGRRLHEARQGESPYNQPALERTVEYFQQCLSSEGGS